MFGNHANSKSLTLQPKKTSNQNSPVKERAADGKLLFDQSTGSTVTLTDDNVSKITSPAGPEHTSTPVGTGVMDVVAGGKTAKSKGHRRTKSLERETLC